jgi:phage protein D/phage baseplate assembly protein gpV
MSLASHMHVAGLEVVIDGQPLSPELRGSLSEVVVADNLNAPGSALIRISARQENIDSSPLQIGKEVEIKASAMDDRTTTAIFKGDIVALEPEYGDGVVTVAARALQRTHKLFAKRQVRTFQQVKASDMARKVISEAGLSAGTIDDTDVVHQHFQQSAESDWEFLNRIALDSDREIVADDRSVHFRKAGEGSGSPIRLAWGNTLLTFRPRMTAIQQTSSVDVRGWDAKNKAVINGSAQVQSANSSPGGKTPSDVISAINATPKVLISDRTVESTSAANEIAKSRVSRQADSFVEAEGTIFGNPNVKAGCKVQIEGVGQLFSGVYVVTQTTHSYRGGTGYKTGFVISGRSARTLLDLMRTPEKRSWTDSLVVGVVTNNNDPDEMGRVKVKFPSLSDNEESYWARVVTPSTGKERGLLMLPQPDEEVVVGFENGDAQRPYVIGSVFNGKDKPGADLYQNKDGSFALQSDKKIWMKAKEEIEIRSDKDMVIEISKDVKEKTSGNFTSETTGNTKLKGQQVTIEAGGSISIKGVSMTVEASGSLTLKGSTVTLQGSGPTAIKGNPIQIG